MWTKKQQDLITLERILTEIANDELLPNMFSRCLDCQTWGNCFPYDRQCGNCNSLNVTRYYSEGVIQIFGQRGIGSQPICKSSIDTGGSPEIRDDKIMAQQSDARFFVDVKRGFISKIE